MKKNDKLRNDKLREAGIKLREAALKRMSEDDQDPSLVTEADKILFSSLEKRREEDRKDFEDMKRKEKKAKSKDKKRKPKFGNNNNKIDYEQEGMY